jgi:hypothetical protein
MRRNAKNISVWFCFGESHFERVEMEKKGVILAHFYHLRVTLEVRECVSCV